MFQTSNWERVLFTKGDFLYATAVSPTDSLLALPCGSLTVTAAAWSPDRRRLAIGTSAGEVVIWEIDQIRSRLDSLGLAW